MNEEERIEFFCDSLMKAIGEGLTIEEYISIKQDIQCVEGRCPKTCTRCVDSV